MAKERARLKGKGNMGSTNPIEEAEETKVQLAKGRTKVPGVNLPPLSVEPSVMEMSRSRDTVGSVEIKWGHKSRFCKSRVQMIFQGTDRRHYAPVTCHRDDDEWVFGITEVGSASSANHQTTSHRLCAACEHARRMRMKLRKLATAYLSCQRLPFVEQTNARLQ
eukprot:2401331-Amphidinium_carterae.2